MFREDFNRPAKVETFTPDLKGLVRWLETQDPSTLYDYSNAWECVFCQAWDGIGHAPRRWDKTFPAIGMRAKRFIGGGVDETYSLASGSWTRGWTFGAALDRARVLLKEP